MSIRNTFQGKLGFKDVATAERSVGLLERVYRILKRVQDRAGQHHSLEMALIMLDLPVGPISCRRRRFTPLADGKLSTPLADIIAGRSVRQEKFASAVTNRISKLQLELMLHPCNINSRLV